MLWVPAVRADVAHAAVRVLPLPDSVTAAQPAIDVPPSVKLIVPVGAVPVTVAVKVTLAPEIEGLELLTSVVVLGAPPALVTWTVNCPPAPAVAETMLKETL